MVVGLNPGRREFATGRFFVGRAGVILRSSRFDPVWDVAGFPHQTLVTSIVKLFTPSAADLDAIDENRIVGCVRRCFVEEIRSLPNLERIVLLGRRTAQLFAAVAFAELQDRERLRIYAVRHPSFAWTVPDLEERLRQSLARPWYEELAASWHAGGPTPQTPR
jgi:uracil-DNA glycosylase